MDGCEKYCPTENTQTARRSKPAAGRKLRKNAAPVRTSQCVSGLGIPTPFPPEGTPLPRLRGAVWGPNDAAREVLARA